MTSAINHKLRLGNLPNVYCNDPTIVFKINLPVGIMVEIAIEKTKFV